MPADNDLDPVDRWLSQQVWPMSPPDGTFERIAKRARRKRIRTAAISVASAAAVAAAVGVAVPLGLAGGFGSPAPSGNAAMPGRSSAAAPSTSQSEDGTGTRVASPSSAASATALPSPAGTAASSATSGPNTPGWLPPNFVPVSTTWVSQYTGYIIGQAGTPGHCGAQQNSDTCTSIAVTHDSGQTWAGVNAPVAKAPNGLTGVSQLRFLDGTNGWAYGPELYATHDAGSTWTKVPTSGQQVTDLETVNGRAYALWAKCTDAATCLSYTLMSTPAGQDNWTAVSGVPANLLAGGTKAPKEPGSASFELTGTEGYLIAPDGSLYSGSVAAGAAGNWHRVSTLPCGPSWLLAGPYGQSLQVLLTPAGTVAGVPRLAVACEVKALPEGFSTTVWVSDDDGTNWTERTGVGTAGVSWIGIAQSLTALPDGTLILGTQSGIYRLPPGAGQWQKATLSGATAPPHGFAYVGMTDSTQGVAIADTYAGISGTARGPEGIWMTFDAGQSWQFRPIQGKS